MHASSMMRYDSRPIEAMVNNLNEIHSRGKTSFELSNNFDI